MGIPLVAPSVEDTVALGRALAPLFREGDVVILTGDLGAGKTTLVRGIAEGLDVVDHVASPTFTLVREYSGRLEVAHVDVYRLGRVQEVVDLALDELGGGRDLLLVEWGDAIAELLPPDRLRVELLQADPTGADETRTIDVGAEGASWAARRTELQRAVRPWSRAPVGEVEA
jgi:tRNA threonylcarbamoyladenosine biosynthesis protein TsaE